MGRDYNESDYKSKKKNRAKGPKKNTPTKKSTLPVTKGGKKAKEIKNSTPPKKKVTATKENNKPEPEENEEEEEES
jgi:hypothetical protein